MGADDEVIKDFLDESREQLDELDGALVPLEANPGDAALLRRCLSLLHSLKGVAGFLGFSRIQGLCHQAESILAGARDHRLSLEPRHVAAVMAAMDQVRALRRGVEQAGAEEEQDVSALLERLRGLAEGGAGASALAVESAAAPEEAPQEPGEAAADANIRVDVGQLDRLMNQVGELVLVRNQLLQQLPRLRDTVLGGAVQRLNLITSELQEGVMKTRMQPVRRVFERLPRAARDAAASLGKRLRFQMEGQDTELDRSLLEAIKEPLLHLVRNAVDHGLEDAAGRAAAGKPAEGRLHLRAWHEGGNVLVELSDDGRGLDLEAVRAKSVSRGLLSAAEASRLNEAETAQLVFLPGLSTREEATHLSGRGVGMDVVKSAVERVGGSVDLSSRPGQGTVVRLRLPLTLAIIPALIVSQDRRRYAVPQASLLELVRLEHDDAKDRLEWVHNVATFRLRGRVLPLVFLGQALGANAAEAQAHGLHICVVEAEGQRFGLVVDLVHDTEEIVVKPLDRLLQGVSSFAGATILGDGQVALILDVPGLMKQAGLSSAAAAEEAAGARAADAASFSRSMVVFQAGPGRAALPLGELSRLEKLSAKSVEAGGGELVTRYRGHIMPLTFLTPLLFPEAPAPQQLPEVLDVVVLGEGADARGLVVDRLLDIHEWDGVSSEIEGRPGLSANAVIADNVTGLLDLEAVLAQRGRQGSLALHLLGGRP
jgi:two-component system chemotaxis sensor kinase CheA